MGFARKIQPTKNTITKTTFSVMSAIVRRNQGWVPSILGDLLGGEWLDSRATSGIIPAINVKETKKNYLVEVAAPGLTKEDFDVHLNENNDLVICMERKVENKEEEKDTHYLRKEFSYSRFQQTMLLPDDVKRDGIDAHVDKGVLHITLPKKPEAVEKHEARKIEIK